MFKLVCRLCLIGLLMAGFTPAQAADERFKVEISVDVTDQDASTAREKAMNEANRAAIIAVANRISTAEGAQKLQAMTDDQLINFIKEVSVIKEKTSSIRYMADLQVVLNENLLTEYMKERQIPLLISGTSRILVVPVFREFVNDTPQLWESSNLWREAWNNPPAGQTVRFISLPTNATNYSLIDGLQAQAVNGQALDKLMRYNGADEVYVLDAVYDGIEGLEVTATSYRGDRQIVRVRGDRNEGIELFRRAAAAVAEKIEARTKQQSLRETSLEAQATVVFNFSSLRQWVEAEKMLKDIPYVKKIEMQAMGTNKAQFKLIFAGNSDKLLTAISRQGYELEDMGKYFRLLKSGD